MPMIRPHRLSDESTFLGQSCALCKQEFEAGDRIVVCPEDGSRHHVRCWEANNNHCTAYGCLGQGEVGLPSPLPARPGSQPRRPRVLEQAAEPPPPRSRTSPPRPPAARSIPNAPGSKVRTLPSGSFGCMRGCLFALAVVAVLLLGLSCAVAWLITENWSLGPAPVQSIVTSLLSPHLLSLL